MVYINEDTNRILSKTIVHTGDILIVRDGSIGTACVVPEKYDGANVVSMIIMSAVESCSAEYICYCLNSRIGKLQFDLTKIGSALTHTSVSSVSNLQLTIPPKEEQDDITKYLDQKCRTIDEALKNKQSLIDRLTSYKKSLIYEVVTGKREVPA